MFVIFHGKPILGSIGNDFILHKGAFTLSSLYYCMLFCLPYFQEYNNSILLPAHSVQCNPTLTQNSLYFHLEKVHLSPPSIIYISVVSWYYNVMWLNCHRPDSTTQIQEESIKILIYKVKWPK